MQFFSAYSAILLSTELAPFLEDEDELSAVSQRDLENLVVVVQCCI